MGDWKILILHTRHSTLLKRSFEAAFPGRTVSLHVPALGTKRYVDAITPADLMSYFRRNIYDPSIWNGRVLTVYGQGDFHHYTYALSRLAAERRGFKRPGGFTYFHVDNHRDDYGGSKLSCGNFVDSIAYDHGAIPFFIGPDAYPFKDARGYLIRGAKIPIYSNFFTKSRQEARDWKGVRTLEGCFTGAELPATRDLRETPIPTYLSFDLDVLTEAEMLTVYDQNPLVTTRHLCRILDRIRPHKKVFSADILGLPDESNHALSALTMVILARKIMGMGTKRLLAYHTRMKQKQAAHITYKRLRLDDLHRNSPVSEEKLLEVLA